MHPPTAPSSNSQFSPTLSFQRQQFPRSFSRRLPATGGRAVSPRCPRPREAARSHPWPGSRSPGCFFPAQEPRQPAQAPSWAPATANHKTQSCRKPGFTRSGSGLRRSTSRPGCKRSVGAWCTAERVGGKNC